MQEFKKVLAGMNKLLTVWFNDRKDYWLIPFSLAISWKESFFSVSDGYVNCEQWQKEQKQNVFLTFRSTEVYLTEWQL